jgi:hypothetical protein
VSIVLTMPRWASWMFEGRGLAERLGGDSLEDRVHRLHPLAPLGDDRELEAARVLVELADQRVHPGRVEGLPIEGVQRGEDPDIGGVATEGAAADLRELLDVVGADVSRPRLEGHDVAQLRSGHLLGHHADEGSSAVRERGDRAVGDRYRRCYQRRFETSIYRLE